MTTFPDLRKHEAVLFHREIPTSADYIILQVPPEKKDQGSNTFRIDLTNAEQRAWFQRIGIHRRIMDKLALYGHAAYFPGANGGRGEVIQVEDKGFQEIPRITEAMFLADQEKKNQGGKWAGVKLGVRRIRKRIFSRF
jgi:hypothetical protein